MDQDLKKHEPKKSENELHWEELVKSMSRPLRLCDLDFTDLDAEDDVDDLAPRSLNGGPPPPPPPTLCMPVIPPPMMMNFPPPPANHMAPFHGANHQNDQNGDVNGTIKKNKKTVWRIGRSHFFVKNLLNLLLQVKLFWKEVREDMLPFSAGKTIWDELPEAHIDVQKLEHLFESRAKDLISKVRVFGFFQCIHVTCRDPHFGYWVSVLRYSFFHKTQMKLLAIYFCLNFLILFLFFVFCSFLFCTLFVYNLYGIFLV